MHRKYLSYEKARNLIADADLLQFRPSPWSIVSRAICVAGRSPFSHSAMAARLNGHVMCLEVREWIGGRSSPLRYHVEKSPRCIDVFRPCRSFEIPHEDGSTETARLDTKGAVETMLRFIRPGEYGYAGVAKAALRHLPFVRWFVPVETDVDGSNGPPFCSQAYAESIRRNFIDPVPNLAGRLTEPGDLTRSPLLANYLFTLE